MLRPAASRNEAVAPTRGELPGHGAQDLIDRRLGTASAARVVRVATQLATAPAKLLLTPVAGAAVGGTLGALSGFSCGAAAVVMSAIAVAEGSGRVAAGRRAGSPPDGRSAAQRCVENGFRYAVAVPAAVVVVPSVLTLALASGAVGGALGAVCGAIGGAVTGLSEGYQAAWDGRWPGRSTSEQLFSP